MLEEFIPANPTVGAHGTKRYREAVAANDVRRVEPKVTITIPLPPKAERVEIKSAERRKFTQPFVTHEEVFRSRR